ncbi:MAG: hypothetical protein WCH41_06890 [Methylophilaceae bacterium]|jgi:hypothetical protein
MKSTNDDYIQKAKGLSQEERDRLLSRMVGKLPKRLQKEKLTPDEAIAIQLEVEEEQLQEWRINMAAIKEKAEKAKAKADEKEAKAKSVKKAPEKKVAVAKPSLATAKTAVAKTTTVKSAVKAKPDVKTAAKTTATAKK